MTKITSPTPYPELWRAFNGGSHIRSITTGGFGTVVELDDTAQQTHIDAVNTAITNYATYQAQADNAATSDSTTLSDFKTGVQNILNRLDNGITTVASDKTALTAAASLAAAKPIIDNILTRENALYTDLKKVIKRLEQLTR